MTSEREKKEILDRKLTGTVIPFSGVPMRMFKSPSSDASKTGIEEAALHIPEEHGEWSISMQWTMENT
ncbi:hypothetical protein WN944_021356 [Citrus x changshan-huyou]|uniref:Uncharacterized protein n=1 Tax=Citrus x changshan-huyou TaxID=2935761 RepID=A0AAP0R2N9_9ROSI